jgi:hypothetical protein
LSFFFWLFRGLRPWLLRAGPPGLQAREPLRRRFCRAAGPTEPGNVSRETFARPDMRWGGGTPLGYDRVISVLVRRAGSLGDGPWALECNAVGVVLAGGILFLFRVAEEQQGGFETIMLEVNG